jgi:hypothetical protein
MTTIMTVDDGGGNGGVDDNDATTTSTARRLRRRGDDNDDGGGDDDDDNDDDNHDGGGGGGGDDDDDDNHVVGPAAQVRQLPAPHQWRISQGLQDRTVDPTDPGTVLGPQTEAGALTITYAAVVVWVCVCCGFVYVSE